MRLRVRVRSPIGPTYLLIGVRTSVVDRHDVHNKGVTQKDVGFVEDEEANTRSPKVAAVDQLSETTWRAHSDGHARVEGLEIVVEGAAYGTTRGRAGERGDLAVGGGLVNGTVSQTRDRKR